MRLTQHHRRSKALPSLRMQTHSGFGQAWAAGCSVAGQAPRHHAHKSQNVTTTTTRALVPLLGLLGLATNTQAQTKHTPPTPCPPCNGHRWKISQREPACNPTTHPHTANKTMPTSGAAFPKAQDAMAAQPKEDTPLVSSSSRTPVSPLEVEFEQGLCSTPRHPHPPTNPPTPSPHIHSDEQPAPPHRADHPGGLGRGGAGCLVHARRRRRRRRRKDRRRRQER